jgi:hypothetical protein
MGTGETSPPARIVSLSSGQPREGFGDAFRYWEPRRIPYNLVLAAVVAGWLVGTWPHFRGSMTLANLLRLLVLALLANVCYSSAYVVEIPMQHSSLVAKWRPRRWMLWLVGTVLAVAFENYWIADEIYPYVH